MARLAPVLTIATVVVALLAGGAGMASAAAPTCSVPAAKTVRSGTITPIPVACSPYTDISGWTASFSVTDPPDHGTVRPGYGAPPVMRYLPEEGYEGPDSFAYRIITPDGTAGPATQTVTVDDDANSPPQCYDAMTAKKVRAGVARTHTVYCSDADNDPLTFSVSTAPGHGTASFGTTTPSGGALTYTPDAGYAGADTLWYTASDGRAVSTPRHLDFDVVSAASNTAPTCTAVTGAKVARNRPGAVSVNCSDADDDPFSIEIVSAPAHGVAEPSGPAPGGYIGRSIAYIPADNYTGPDSFTVRARDTAGATSGVTPVSLEVAAPSVAGSTFCYGPDPVTVRAGATTALAAQCMFAAPGAPEVLTDPAHGTVRVRDGQFDYTPAAGYTGPDSFTYRILGVEGSGPQSMSITVATNVDTNLWCVGVPQGPSAGFSMNSEAVVRAGSTVPVRLSCSSNDLAPVALQALDPEHGDLGPLVPVAPGLGEVVARVTTYTPDPGFTGFDAVYAQGTDKDGKVAKGAVPFVVRPATFNSAPSCANAGAVDVLIAGEEGEFWVYCSDPEGDPVTLKVLDAPDHLALGGFLDDGEFRRVATLRAPSGFTGVDSFAVRAVDSRGAEELGTTVRFVRVIAPPPLIGLDAGRGDVVGAGEYAQPTPERPGSAQVRVLNEGRVRIETRPGSAPDGFAPFGLTFAVSAPDAIPEVPLRLRFRFDASLLAVGEAPSSITVFRDGSQVAACLDQVAAKPNPCVLSRRILASGDVELVVLSTRAGTWSFGRAVRLAPAPAPEVPPVTPMPPGGGGGNFGGSSPQPQPQPTPPTLTLGALPKLRAALAKGFQVKLTSTYAGTARAKLTLDGKTAKRLKLSKGKPVAVATGTTSAAAGRQTTITLRFTKAAKRALAKAKKVTFTLQAGVNDGPVTTKTLTLKR